MRRAGRLVIAMAGIFALVGVIYRGPLMELAEAFKTEIMYYFSINPDDALKGEVGDVDSQAISNRVKDVKVKDESELESTSGIVHDMFMEKLPFIKKTGDWINEKILGKDVEGSEGSEGSTEEGSEDANEGSEVESSEGSKEESPEGNETSSEE